MDAFKSLLHKRAAVEAQDRTGVEVKFYIDGSLEETLKIPRAQVVAGKDLLDDADRKGGWTSWGKVIVESVDDDKVATSAGDLTKTHNISIEKSNVMPYSDGEVKIRLLFDAAKITVPAEGDKPERVFYMNPDDFTLAQNGNLKGLKQVLEALDAQLPTEADLIDPYKQIVKHLEEGLDWKEMHWVEDIWDSKLGEHVRIEAYIPKDAFARICAENDDKDDRYIHPSGPHSSATVWEMYDIDAEGNAHPREFKESESNFLLEAVPYLDISWPQEKQMYVALGYRYFQWVEDEAHGVVLHADIPLTFTMKQQYGKHTLTLTLSSTATDKKTSLRKLLDKFNPDANKEEMTDWMYDVKYFSGVEKQYEKALWLRTQQGQKVVETVKKVVGYLELSDPKTLLDNIRFKQSAVRGRANELLGDIYFEEGNAERAKACYQEAAKAYEALGDLDSALRAMSKAESACAPEP